MQGYIKLYRKIMDSPVWDDPYYLKLWMYCLLKATHKKREVFIGNQVITLQPGEFITGRAVLADDFNKGVKKSDVVSDRTLWRWMKFLEKADFLSIKSTTKYSVISINNWSQYQVDDQQMSSECPTNVQHVSTNKNVKNDKNVKKKEYIPFSEIIEYLNEKTGKKFKPTTRKTKELIHARWEEGNRLEDFKQVIDICCSKWKGQIFKNGANGDDYLQPSTLFNGKFEERLNWTEQKKSNVVPIKPEQEDHRNYGF